ncbi:hypothetical protein L195_g006615, partial [Trifolium pratense]
RDEEKRIDTATAVSGLPPHITTISGRNFHRRSPTPLQLNGQSSLSYSFSVSLSLLVYPD